MKNYFRILSSTVNRLSICGKTWNLFMNKNLIMLLQQWYSYQKELGDDVATYIVKIENFAHQLQTLGKKIPNQMIITKILITFVIQILYCVWESTQSNERTLTNLISRLTIEEARIGTEERAENIAFTANKHQYKKNFKKGNVRPGVCHYCHRTLDQGMQKPKSSKRKVHRKERRGTYWSHVCRI